MVAPALQPRTASADSTAIWPTCNLQVLPRKGRVYRACWRSPIRRALQAVSVRTREPLPEGQLVRAEMRPLLLRTSRRGGRIVSCGTAFATPLCRIAQEVVSMARITTEVRSAHLLSARLTGPASGPGHRFQSVLAGRLLAGAGTARLTSRSSLAGPVSRNVDDPARAHDIPPGAVPGDPNPTTGEPTYWYPLRRPLPTSGFDPARCFGWISPEAIVANAYGSPANPAAWDVYWREYLATVWRLAGSGTSSFIQLRPR